MDYDLEETIFKRNIPGKYHRWDKDGDEQGHREDRNDAENVSEDEECNEEIELNMDDPLQKQMNSTTTEKLLLDDTIPDEIKISILNERNKKHNTGVKSVLADRKAHKDLERALHDAKQRERNAILHRIAAGATLPLQEGEPVSQFVKATAAELSDDDSDDDNDEFLAAFRAKRIAELKAVSSLPTFRSVKEISDDGLVEQLESVDKRVFVVVHLYEPGITSCVRMNRILEDISHSPSMTHVMFLRMACSRNGLKIDRVAFPMVSIYRGGILEQTFAGDADFGGEYFKIEDVQWLLDSHFQS